MSEIRNYLVANPIHIETGYFSDVLGKKVSIFVCLMFWMRIAASKL